MKKYIISFLLMLIVPLMASAQGSPVTVTGTVTDPQGEPLLGVIVSVENMPGLGTLTDEFGKYSLKVERYQALLFAYTGYETSRVLVGDDLTINVQMEISDDNVLEEIVVTGQGDVKRISVTAALTNVAVEDLKHTTGSSLSNNLAGMAAGILTQQRSGQPGRATSEFWIRGISTFGAGSAALILVDGFERSSLDELNIEDIASFTVLKDAAATAIYGTKGANGVVLITTRRGEAGRVTIDAKFEASYHTRTYTPEFVDGVTYANLANEAQISRNLGLAYRPEEIELIRSQADPNFYPDVDWKKILLKNSAMSYRANLNMSGGGNMARYYVSAAYVEDQGMYRTDQTLRDKYDSNANYKRWNYRLNVDMDITKTTLLRVGVGGSLELQNEPGVSNGNIWGALFGFNAVSTPIWYEEDGVQYAPALGGGDGRINPWTQATQTGYSETWRNNLQTNVSLDQKLDFITKGLKISGRFGYDTNNGTNIGHRTTPALYRAQGRNQETGKLVLQTISGASDMVQSSSNTGSRREFLELLLNWNREFGHHRPSATLRYTSDVNRQTVALGTDLKNSVARRNLNFAGQVAYNWKLRYFLDFNLTYSGSENFADGQRFGLSPAYSLAWNVAEEPFIKNNMTWLSMLKIRWSQGLIGNDNTGDRFPYLYTIAQNLNEDGTAWYDRYYNFGFGSGTSNTTGLSFSQYASPGVTWEFAHKKDLGVDISILNDKISLTVDYFNEKRTGIFQARAALPEITGLTSQPKANVGAMQNEGFDGHFSFKQKIGEVNITARGNMTYSKNVILERDEVWQVYPYLYSKGYRHDQQKGLVAMGLFKDYEDIRNSPKQTWNAVQPGDIKYADVNGDGIVNGDDRVAIGSTIRPSFGYGFGLSAYWKNLDFNFFFQGAGNSTFRIYGKSVFAFSEGSWGNIFAGMIGDRYIDADTATKLGIPANEDPNAKYPRLSYNANNNNQQESSYWIRNGRYIRLKNMDIGYSLPRKFAQRMFLNNLRVYLAAQNLFTWAPFTMWDPESADPRGENYPLTRSVTLGITVKL